MYQMAWYPLLLVCAFLSATTLARPSSLRSSLEKAGVAAVFPEDPGYTNATLPYNQRFTFSPVAVAFPTDDKQVSSVVLAGASEGVNVVARSGGHSYINNGLGGKNGSLVVDLSRMRKIVYDGSTGVATIQTGNRLGDIALALDAEGRLLPHGRCTYVGLGGHIAHGGWGFLSRSLGLTLDTIQSANVVFADGSIARVSKDSDAELFWGLRGSASSFGIITSLDLKTSPVPPSSTIFTYTWYPNASLATTIFAEWQSFSLRKDLPRKFGGELLIQPDNVKNGVLTVLFFGGYFGPAETFNATIAPFMDKLPPPVFTTVTSGNWRTALEAMVYGNLDTSTGTQMRDTFYVKSMMTPEDTPLSMTAMAAFMEFCATKGLSHDGYWHIEIELYGGRDSAINAVPVDDTAFARRDTLFTVQFYAHSPDFLPPFPEQTFTFLDDMYATIVSNMPRNWNYGGYVNYIEDREKHWQDFYYGKHYKRLQALKASVDPQNLFEFPFSIQPQAAAAVGGNLTPVAGL